MRDTITEQWLHDHARLLVSKINHREYLFCGVRWYCGYKSPHKSGLDGNWIVYKATMEQV
jgi:hypothetical protein